MGRWKRIWERNVERQARKEAKAEWEAGSLGVADVFMDRMYTASMDLERRIVSTLVELSPGERAWLHKNWCIFDELGPDSGRAFPAPTWRRKRYWRIMLGRQATEEVIAREIEAVCSEHRPIGPNEQTTRHTTSLDLMADRQLIVTRRMKGRVLDTLRKLPEAVLAVVAHDCIFVEVRADDGIAFGGDLATRLQWPSWVFLSDSVIEPVIAHEIAHALLRHPTRRRRSTSGDIPISDELAAWKLVQLWGWDITPYAAGWAGWQALWDSQRRATGQEFLF